MNEHLKAAVKRYKPNQVKINPISEIDAEIVVELIEVFKKLRQTKLEQIIKEYKFLKDEDVRGKLLEWNTEFNQDEGEINPDQDIEEVKVHDVIKLQGKIFYLSDILTFERFERWDVDRESKVYSILINRTPEEARTIPIHANEKIWYYSHSTREEDFKRLEKYFEDKDNINIIE